VIHGSAQQLEPPGLLKATRMLRAAPLQLPTPRANPPKVRILLQGPVVFSPLLLSGTSWALFLHSPILALVALTHVGTGTCHVAGRGRM